MFHYDGPQPHQHHARDSPYGAYVDEANPAQAAFGQLVEDGGDGAAGAGAGAGEGVDAAEGANEAPSPPAVVLHARGLPAPRARVDEEGDGAAPRHGAQSEATQRRTDCSHTGGGRRRWNGRGKCRRTHCETAPRHHFDEPCAVKLQFVQFVYRTHSPLCCKGLTVALAPHICSSAAVQCSANSRSVADVRLVALLALLTQHVRSCIS